MTGNPFRTELAAALWATVKRDHLAQLALVTAAVLAFLYLSPVLPAERRRAEALMFVWLLSMGGVALIQNRLLERGRRQLEDGTATLSAELAWRARMAAERQEFLSQLREKEKEIEARNAELERLTYTVSHDLKDPLVTIRGFLGLLASETDRGELERAPKHIAIIDRAAARMARLLEELMELLKIGRVVAEPREVALDELAREAAARLTDPLDEGGVTVAIASDLPAVTGDPERLLEVFQNLLDNALRYTGSEERPRVEIGWRQDPESSDRVFFVRDNGAGIEPRDQRRVFDLFTRLDPQIEGTGVGLALAKRIVESHGGRIWVESDGRGHGSTFCFTLGGDQGS